MSVRASYDDTHVPYDLTDAGWAATRRVMVTVEAAALVGIDRRVVTDAALAGDLPAEKVGQGWVFDREAVKAWAAREGLPDPHPRRLPAGPLIEQVRLRGGARALGVASGSAEERALERAAAEGSLTARAADHLATTLLGMCTWQLWGAA